MANLKITQLPPVSTVTGATVLPVVIDAVTSQLNIENLAKSLPQVTSSLSASLAVSASQAQSATTASHAVTAVSASFATTSQLPLQGVTTASAAGSTITFTKGDSTTFSVTVTGASAESASYVSSSNVDGPLGKNSIVSSSYAVSSSLAISASWSPASSAFPFTGIAQITGSLVVSGSAGEGITVIPESGYSALSAYDSSIVARDYSNNNRAYVSAQDSTSTIYAQIGYNVGFGSYIALSNGTYTGYITTGSNWNGYYFYRLPAMSGEIAVFPYTGSARITGSLALTGSMKVTGSLSVNTSGSLILPGTASSSPVAGNFYFDFTVNKLYAYNGSTWVTASLG